jgi:hypothetical protein
VGIVYLHCKFKDTEAYIDFMAVECDTPVLLGVFGCVALNLIKRVNTVSTSVDTPKDKFIRDNQDVFNGLGSFPELCSILTVKGAKPPSWLPTKVANARKAPLKEELDRLVRRNAIVKVEQLDSRAWINNIVLTEKANKKVRLCLDPSDLNKCVVR